MSGTSLALKIGSLVLGLGAFFVLFKKVKGLKKYGLSSLFYVLITALLLSASTLFLFHAPTSNEMTSLILAQFTILIISTLHVFFAPKLLPWHNGQSFGMQVVFIICMLLFGYFFFNLSFSFLVESEAEIIWNLSLLWFLVPVLLSQTIIKLVEIPSKEYKKWRYPLGENIEDPSDEEMENPVVISFVFKKNPDAPEETTFRAKAPLGMTLGRLFYFFINDYNSRHPESTISCANKGKVPDEWIFFKRKSKFLNLKTALDPEIEMASCRIKENDVLICSRVILTEKKSQNETNK